MTSAFSLCCPNSQACDGADMGVRCDQHLALRRDFLIASNAVTDAVQYNTQPLGGGAAAVTPRAQERRTAHTMDAQRAFFADDPALTVAGQATRASSDGGLQRTKETCFMQEPHSSPAQSGIVREYTSSRAFRRDAQKVYTHTGYTVSHMTGMPDRGGLRLLLSWWPPQEHLVITYQAPTIARAVTANGR